MSAHTLAPLKSKPVPTTKPDGLGPTLTWQARRLAAGARWLGQRVLRVARPMGLSALALAAVLALVGLALGWAEVVLIAMALGFALAAAVAFVVGRTFYDVHLDLARLRVRVGEQAFGRVVVNNPTSRRRRGCEAFLPVGLGTARFRVPRLAAGTSHDEMFTIPTERRCVVLVGPVQSFRQDPFGLLRRSQRLSPSHELFVHPRTVSLEGSSAGFLRDLEGRPTDDLSSSDVAFHALREYVPGDDRRYIHWKTSAKVGRLMVRQFEESRRSHLVVALSTDLDEYQDAAELELAISVAASLGLQAIKEEKDLTVVSSDGALRSQSGGRLLDDCSRITPRQGANGIDQVARAAAAQVPDASTAVLVTGSLPNPAKLRCALSGFSVEVMAAAVRCARGTTLGRRSLGDAPVVSLGELADLPLGMRSL